MLTRKTQKTVSLGFCRPSQDLLTIVKKSCHGSQKVLRLGSKYLQSTIFVLYHPISIPLQAHTSSFGHYVDLSRHRGKVHCLQNRVLHQNKLTDKLLANTVKDFLKPASEFFSYYFTKYFLPLMIYSPLARVDLSPPTNLPSIV